MTAIVVEIDKDTYRILIRGPDGSEQSTINEKPHLLYWVKARNGQVLEGMDADGLAKVLAELGVIDAIVNDEGASEVVSEIDAIVELEPGPTTADLSGDDGVMYALGAFDDIEGPWLGFDGFVRNTVNQFNTGGWTK